MRRLVGPTIAATLLAAAPLAAQMPRGEALAPGEVALHVVAHGETTTPADRIVVTVPVAGKAADAAGAKTAAQAEAARVTQALVAAGIDRAAIVVARPITGVVVTAPPFVRPVPAPPAPMPPSGSGAPGPAPMQTATATMTVTVASRAALDRATQAIEAEGQSVNGKPQASLVDAAAARRAATLAALTRARGDADDYAAALGMRVGRTVAVSNAAGLGDGVGELADIFQSLGDRSATPDRIVTRATATVDYVLVPAR